MKSVLPVMAVMIIIAACITLPATAAVYYDSSIPQIITRGDAFSVSGTGATNGPVALWVIGRKYFEIRSTAPDRRGNFSIVFQPTETEKFSTGQYAVVLQDPGASGTMEIEPGRDSNGNLTIMNRGKIIARLGAQEDLQGNVQAETYALTSAAGLQGVDDTFLPEYFFVEEPSVQFDGIIPASGSRLPDKVSGGQVLFTGTTNLGTENTLMAEIRTPGSTSPVTSKELPIIAGKSLNIWSYGIEEPGLEPGDYLLTVGSADSRANSTAQFTVAETRTVTPTPEQTGISGIVALPKGLDTLLILGIIFVFAVVVYTTSKK
ncbi:MAG: hypothetical protein ABSG49_02545 [Methanoregula sp.]|jgi:hypothetical protein|uniref:hypothetical protein n=1 Tax=Methanoregula sp. TaxID=2052170 RepID=UPI003C1753CB